MRKEATMNTLDNPNLDGDFKALIKVQEVNVYSSIYPWSRINRCTTLFAVIIRVKCNSNSLKRIWKEN